MRTSPVRSHRNNTHLYRGLLNTRLTDLERQFIEPRLSEEQAEPEGARLRNLPTRVYRAEDLGWAGSRGGRAMTDIRVFLIRGSEKIVSHYRLLLASSKTEKERELYRSRIEREQKLLDELRGGFLDRLAA
jgi:hypothetical protein